MKRTATTDQRQLRCSLACAHLEFTDARLHMPVTGFGASLAVRPAYLRNRYASCGSAVV